MNARAFASQSFHDHRISRKDAKDAKSLCGLGGLCEKKRTVVETWDGTQWIQTVQELGGDGLYHIVETRDRAGRRMA